MDGRAIFHLVTRTGPGAAQSGIVLGYAFCTCITEFLRSARVGTINPRNVYLNEGRTRWPMPRLPNNPDRDFSAGQSEDDINANVAELFASRPLGVAELFADPIVQVRIGRLITEAMGKRTRRQRADKPR